MHAMLLILAVLSGAPAPAEPDPGITAAVSPLLPSLCRPGEGGEGVLRCAGLVGTDVFLRGDEAAREPSLGAPNGFLAPPPGGARLGRSVTWRILGDKPIAGILRYRFADGWEVLVVLKPGREGAPGCPVGIVENGEAPSGSGPDRAAALADRRALFRCGSDRPVSTARGR